MIYLYAFADEEAAGLGEWRGLAGAPLRSVTRGPVTAVFSVHARLPIRPEVASLRVHDQVVTTLMARCTVAPVRFGAALADLDQLDEVLVDKAPGLASVLFRLRGKQELAVRASMPEGGDRATSQERSGSGASAGPGRAYLLGLSRDHAGRMTPGEPSFVGLHEALAARASAATVREVARRSMVGAYLVPEGDTEKFRDTLVAARAEQPQLRVSLTGPWAAYSFVETEALVGA